MMYKKFLLLGILLALINVSTFAQRKTVYGFLKDSLTDFSIPVGTITNATTNTAVNTDSKGFFKIQVAPGDFIYAVAKSYRYDTLNYSYIYTDTITIYLAPSGTILPNVIVTANYTKYQLDSIGRKADFEKLRGTPLRTIDNNRSSGFGLTLNLDRVLKSKYKNQRGKEKRFDSSEKQAYINYRFSPHFVAYYTRLKGEALSNFLNRYTPDFNWLRKHTTNEEVILYINDKLKEFRNEANK